MLKNKSISHVFLGASIVSWLIFAFISKNSVIVVDANLDIDISNESPFLLNVFLSLFFLFVFQYYRVHTESLKGFNFNDLIWQGFITGALMFVASLLTRQVLRPENNFLFAERPIYIDLVNNINIIFVTLFCAKTFYVFKRMILYQKSKSLALFWIIYEYLIYGSLALNLFNVHIFDTFIVVFISIYSALALILSLNMKWVAYLNFKQKWRNLLLILLILLIAGSFIQYVYSQSLHFGDSSSKHFIVNDLAQKIFIILICIFIIFYCLSSILVILFNFPTSSVFEQKLGEVFNFQKLSQSIQMTEQEDQIYDVLLETSRSTVMADAAWLEIIDEKGNYSAFINQGIEKFDIFEIKKVLKKNHYDIKSGILHFNSLKKLKHQDNIAALPYKSILIVPLIFQNKYLGQLGLIKNINDGFEKEIIDVISSFSSQASVSIENSRLMVEAIETERYKEEIKIAKNVQQSLLPQSLDYNISFQISAFSNAADEVGGDYYDTYSISKTKTAIVIADVSGHGTSAAFNMAQLKGVLQSLLQLELPLDETLFQINRALSRCLEKKTFITLTLYHIDTEINKITCVRAGHCPTLYYSSQNEKTFFFENKGLGLGILRNDLYRNHIEVFEHNFRPNDCMLLYTDGIVEAKDSKSEEYGFDRLKNIFSNNINEDPSVIIKNIIDNLYQFCENQKLSDDYTCLAIKFI